MGKNVSKRVVLAFIALCLLIAGFAAVYGVTREKTVKGAKSIAVEIIKAEGESKTVEIKTDAEYLRQALEEVTLVQGDDSGAHGLFVKTVDGYTVDEFKREWWLFTKNGEMLTTGVDETPIADGDHYEITLNTGY